MKSLKSLNENAYYTNCTIPSHIKFFFTKFLYIKYCLYDSIKILTPNIPLICKTQYLVGTSTLTTSIRMKCFRANLILGVHCLMFLSWIELSFLVFLIFEATWPLTSMDG